MVVVITYRDIQARLAGTDSVMLRLLNIFTQYLREQARVFIKITSSPLLNK
jgi:hypothetical protein